MLPYKVRTGGHILGCVIGGVVHSVVRSVPAGARAALAEMARGFLVLTMTIGAVVRLRGKYRVSRLIELAEQAGALRSWLLANPEAVATFAERLNIEQRYEALLALIEPHLQNDQNSAKLLALRALAHLGLGHYPEALADFARVSELRPALARDMTYEQNRCYLLGLRGEVAAARQAMAAQWLEPGDSSSPEIGLAQSLYDQISPHVARMGLKGTIGVVIGNFQTALGHAILDPFHFIQLFRSRFDHLVLVHPPYEKYTPALRISAIILDQYVEQIETTDRYTLSFAWQNLGELTCQNITFLVHHYWSLNRMAFAARSNPNHPLAHGRQYLAFPPKLASRGESILRRNGFDLDKPLVVVHTREHGYHALSGQRFRNTDVRNYEPALQRLVELGYQVVRIGDRQLTSVRHNVPGVIELPTAGYHDPVLDPYLISRCRFMISCQSGPCSYARAFGKPNLVLNAVYHYTLLPERQELLGFKQYCHAETNEALDVDRIFGIGAHLFDRAEQFEAAGIRIDDMTPEEILAATEEMLDWLDDPDQPETASQRRFRQRMNWYAKHPDRSNPLSNPMNDYIGYALPECRISDAVCRLRPEFLAASRRELQAA
jgi:putative glycosyltransferase (TIGR04372 family)